MKGRSVGEAEVEASDEASGEPSRSLEGGGFKRSLRVFTPAFPILQAVIAPDGGSSACVDPELIYSSAASARGRFRLPEGFVS